MKRLFALGAVFIVLLLAGGAFIVIAKPFDSPMLKACEEVFIKTLRSPSTYSRVSVGEFRQPITVDEWRSKTLARREINNRIVEQEAVRMKAEGVTPAWLVIHVAYDAQNGFGATIRDTFDCRVLSQDGVQAKTGRHDVIVNGKTLLDWLYG